MRRTTRRPTALLALSLLLPLAARAQEEPPDPDRGLPLEPARFARFTTSEGTWISLDVSPDGSALVFDLLGDLYRIPIDGGRATRLTGDIAHDMQPRFSPDGERVVFVSDRSGDNNVWIVPARGGEPTQVSEGIGSRFLSPEWTPDGKYIVVSRAAPLRGLEKLWLYHVEGGTGVEMVDGAPGLRMLGPAVAPDGRYVWYHQRFGSWSYNAILPQYQLWVYDRDSGTRTPMSDRYGSAFRPAVSPDGKWLAYASRHDAETGLRLRELATGEERWLLYPVQRDEQESIANMDVLPGYAWTPGSDALVASYGGGIWRVPVDGSDPVPIPFTVEAEVALGPDVSFEYPVEDTPTFTVKHVRDAVPSPDGTRVAFTALDRLYVADVAGGEPRRLTDQEVGEYYPAWSPDGTRVAFVTLGPDAEGGHILSVPAAGGTPRGLTTVPAFYQQIAWSPDGERIVAIRSSARNVAEAVDPFIFQGLDAELVWIPAGGGEATVIGPTEGRQRPHFTSDPDRIYTYGVSEAPAPPGSPGRGPRTVALSSTRWDGTDLEQHVRVTARFDLDAGSYAAGYAIDPTSDLVLPADYGREPAAWEQMAGLDASGADGPPPELAAFGGVRTGAGPGADAVASGGSARELVPRRSASLILMAPRGDLALALVGRDLYAVTVPEIGADVPVVDVTKPDSASVPAWRLDELGAEFPAWGADGRTLHWSLGNAFVSYDLDAAAADAAYEPTARRIEVQAPRDVPRGTLVLRGARAVTMRGDEILENADVVIRDNRIASVSAGPGPVPDGAEVIDVSGRTIVPGFVDTHAHMWNLWNVHWERPWIYQANLAYGVTTTRDPQTATSDVFTYEDRVRAGQMVGPRIYSTGPGVFSSDAVRSLDHARTVLRKYSDYWDTKTFKMYMSGNRRQRQWLIMAARELGLMPTTEGGLDYRLNMTHAIDGYPGVEHTMPVIPAYGDVVELFRASGTTNTPTLLVSYGGPWAENYYYTHEDVVGDAKLNHFTPKREIDFKARRLQTSGPGPGGWFMDEEYAFRKHAAWIARLVEAGGGAGVGSHGQLQGLGYHWELWNVQSGGMSEHDALRAATILGAEALGLARDLGSLEPGKLADLVILERNPLDDIRNTNAIDRVMMNGRLYDGDTLDEVWPRRRSAPPEPWRNVAPDVPAGVPGVVRGGGR